MWVSGHLNCVSLITIISLIHWLLAPIPMEETIDRVIFNPPVISGICWIVEGETALIGCWNPGYQGLSSI